MGMSRFVINSHIDVLKIIIADSNERKRKNMFENLADLSMSKKRSSMPLQSIESVHYTRSVYL